MDGEYGGNEAQHLLLVKPVYGGVQIERNPSPRSLAHLVQVEYICQATSKTTRAFPNSIALDCESAYYLP